jgi:hypothetical protein
MPLFTKRGTAFLLKDITMKRMSYLSFPLLNPLFVNNDGINHEWSKKDQFNKRIIDKSSFHRTMKWKWVYIKKVLHEFQHGIKRKINTLFSAISGRGRSSGIGTSEGWFLKQEEWICQLKQDSKINLWLTCYILIYDPSKKRIHTRSRSSRS